MKIFRDVMICKSCDTGIYARVVNETDISCDCGKCSIEGESYFYRIGPDSLCLSYKNALVLTSGEPTEGEDYESKTVPLRTTQEKLEYDYSEFLDKFGKIRNASKAIPAILRMDGKPLELKRRHYEDIVSEYIEEDIEKNLELKEDDLTL